MTTHRNETVRVVDVARYDSIRNVDVLYEETFEDCEIIGPAVLYLGNRNVLDSCNFEGWPGWELIPEQTRIVGAIAAEHCRFVRCRFERVGITGRDAVALLKRDMGTSRS